MNGKGGSPPLTEFFSDSFCRSVPPEFLRSFFSSSPSWFDILTSFEGKIQCHGCLAQALKSFTKHTFFSNQLRSHGYIVLTWAATGKMSQTITAYDFSNCSNFFCFYLQLGRTNRIFEDQEVSQGVNPLLSVLSLQFSVLSLQSSVLGPQSLVFSPQSSILNP